MARMPCDMARLTMDVVQDSVPQALEKRIDLGYDGAGPGAPGVALRGNPTLIKELVRNLVVNAINYTPSTPERQGVITARVLADPFGKVLVVQVEDNGPGIPEEERALGTNVDGSGLGLPIVREIARQHGATITIDDAHPGQKPPGACFTVRFGTGEEPETPAAGPVR